MCAKRTERRRRTVEKKKLQKLNEVREVKNVFLEQKNKRVREQRSKRLYSWQAKRSIVTFVLLLLCSKY